MELRTVSVGRPRAVTIGGEEVSTGIFEKPVRGRIGVLLCCSRPRTDVAIDG